MFHVQGLPVQHIATFHDCSFQNVVSVLGRFHTAYQRYSDVIRNMGGDEPNALYPDDSGLADAPARRSRVAKTYMPDGALARIVGPGPLTRQDALKQVWAYIRAKELQDPADKRQIRSDATLTPLFGAGAFPMHAVLGMLAKHLTVSEFTACSSNR